MIGIIGGTGLYRLSGLGETQAQSVSTPFGEPSAPVMIGKLGSRKVAFLPRHGEKHDLLPGEINYRANIWALKSVGVRRIIGVTAVGSLAEEIRPGDLALPSQYLDFTKGSRRHTFFGEGLVAHVSTARPVCGSLSEKALASAKARKLQIHPDKTYACVEGPRFGNCAESHLLRQFGGHVVGMTNVPEVYLAREAQVCYLSVSVITDYDCWKEDPGQHVTAEQVAISYRKSLESVRALLEDLVTSDESGFAPCSCRRSLEGALMVPETALAAGPKSRWEFLRS